MPLVPVPTNAVNDAVAIGLEQGAVYALTGPDGTRVVLNDRTDADFIGWLTSPPAGLDSPEVRESADLLVEADGGVHGAFYFGRRPFTLEGIIDPTPGPLDYRETELPVATNLAQNGELRSDAGGWSLFAGGSGNTGSSARATDAPREGTVAHYKGTATTSATPPASFQSELQHTGAATGSAGTSTVEALGGPGSTVRMLGSLRLDAAGAGTAVLALVANVYTAAGAYVGSPLIVAEPVLPTTVAGPTAGTWYDLAASFVLPAAFGATPVTGDMVVRTIGALRLTTPAASTAYTYSMTRAAIYTGAETRDYFTGEAPGPTGFPLRSRWAGAAYASRAVLYDVTRTPLDSGAVANRRINRLQRASRALRGDARLEWQPQTGPPVRVAGRRAQALRVSDRLPKRFSLSMVAADPRIYGQAVRTIAGTVGGGAVRAQSDGNSPSAPVVTIRPTGTITSPITLTGPNGQVRLVLGLVAGDVLVVDFYARTVTVNGANRYDAVDFPQTTWWNVEPGANDVTVTSGGGPAGWELAWRDAWT